METLLNAINFTDFFMLETGYEVGIDALGKFAQAVIEGIGIVGLGIIVFALVLKAIVLPFDIYQRVKMRKQTLIMREMKPELEKLQKQYANDKTMYNQKMMELYKKNGYSMLGACLPMIISMVILIIAFQGFRSYSDQANLKMYVEMSEVYNRAVAEYVVDGKDYYLSDNPDDAEKELVFNRADWENDTHTEDGIVYTVYSVTLKEEDGTEKQVPRMRVESTDAMKCVYYEYDLLNNQAGNRNYKIDKDKLFQIDGAEEQIRENMQSQDVSEDVACRNYLIKPGGLAVKHWYEEEMGNKPAGFLWIKNVWQSDVTFRQPIQNWDGFSGTFGNFNVTYTEGSKAGTEAAFSVVWDSGKYNALISEIGEHTGDYNGYYILVILSIGLMVLSQFISMRSNKESNKYQTVDGSGAKTQKIMMVMLPLIYAVFAFMYSAAFSLYMVMSSFISILVTLLSNLIIGKIFRKKEEAAIVEKRTRTLPWMNQDQKKGKKDKKSRK